ncbi:MAG: hypothetical protein P0Y56_04745 [Candidatus Andeanibacterium colombiense]|uniref:Sulfatase N-terminal domain-containing protein n=1 Tax=Candidatus Andeanibacterium colombiense TaxID=3121345 RepID=A0AAJ6BQM9_9SPHN|nr:MAG: hypothetical protein P0Y56_04745 [Sphingomonadaceae bacterium]
MLALLWRSLPWRWPLFWLVVPNLALILMWPIGGPPMKPALLIFGWLALVVSQLPWTWFKRAVLFLMIAVTTVFYVCEMFNIHPLDIWLLPSFLKEIHPWQSWEYVLAGAVFLIAGGIALYQAPRVPRFRSIPSALLALLAVFGLAGLDGIATAATRGSYHSAPLPGEPFSSATHSAGLQQPPADRRNVLLIVVEALGAPAGEVERGLFNADWNRPGWSGRYEVRHGTVPYYGSTTNGELRELCGVWGEYVRFDFAKADCMPARYGRAGYRTVAMHSFPGTFFDRDHWYPKLHFNERQFGAELRKAGARHCGGVFPGACDTDVPKQIAARLKAAKSPQFVYWLTLNSHLPVIADKALGTDHCDIGPRDWREDHPQICRMFLLHHRLADSIDAMAMDPTLPPTDILIVGDHMPPFFDRDGRMRFNGSQVPWIYLKAKGTTEPASSVPRSH